MPPNLFIHRSHQVPAGPTSRQPRISAEERRREIMINEDPEGYRNESKFGPIPGVEVGATWNSRDECAKAGVHAPNRAGIWGGNNGAYSIVMSGGYGDDVDKGDTITYTGTGGYGDDKRYGGNNSSWGSSIQVQDQSFDHKDNEALYISCELGKLVRVIRGHHLGSKYAPQAGYRYDGLYKVINAYMDKSKDGVYQICRFDLVREPDQPPIPTRWN